MSRSSPAAKHDGGNSGRRALGFIRMVRSEDTLELLQDPMAFALLALIAYRAVWRSGFNNAGLKFGEALIGDHKSVGMSRAEYRRRLTKLKDAAFVTTQRTNKGTIATLNTTTVFDLSRTTVPDETSHQKRHQRAISEPSESQQRANSEPLTNKEKKEKNAEKEIKELEFPASAGRAFRKKWDQWTEARQAIGKKPRNWTAMFQEQLDWLGEFPEAQAIEIMSGSIRNGWQGLFAPKDRPAAKQAGGAALSKCQLDRIPVTTI